MAGGVFSSALLNGMTIRESANDGSDFTNPAADYRRLFLGEDGQLHVKDSAGTVTDIGASTGIAATIFDAKGDIIVATAADTAARKAVGANGSVLIASSGQSDGLKWTPGLYLSRRLTNAGTAAVTENVNSTAYLDSFNLGFAHDWDQFPATHFQITCVACSNAAAATITLQLTPFGSPTNPVSASGDDLAIPNNGGTVQFLDSGWIAVSDAMAGIDHLQLAVKGSTATVDLTYRWIDIAFKIAS